MKKIYFFAALAATLAMAGCSNEEFATTTDPTNPTQGEGIVTIGLTNTTTRAARPLGSSAAANNVNSVKLVVLKDNSGTYSEDTNVGIDGDNDMVISWTAPAGEAPSTDGHMTYQSVKLTGLAENAKYKIVAYGYNVQTAGGAASFTATATSSNAAVFGISGFSRLVERGFQEYSLASLNMKKPMSPTPLKCVRRALILALNDSAEALVNLPSK